MKTKAIEMLIEPGAEKLIAKMGRRLNTKARSKIINLILSHIREEYHNSEITEWFSEIRFSANKRTTIRINLENADYLNFISQVVAQGRPSVTLELVYFAAANLSREDLESLV
ncbi:hypothetical protein OAP69_05105 [Hellea sp.]|jgi:hypothetical protein|nr:hypothetical protein [Hellea sp.]